MSKTVCKCGAVYEDDSPFEDERCDACSRCSNYARTKDAPTEFRDESGRVRVVWENKPPTRLLS